MWCVLIMYTRLYTTQYYFVLDSIMLRYTVLLCSTQYYFDLNFPKSQLFQKRSLPDKALYYRLLVSGVLRYPVRRGTTQYYFVLPITT